MKIKGKYMKRLIFITLYLVIVCLPVSASYSNRKLAESILLVPKPGVSIQIWHGIKRIINSYMDMPKDINIITQRLFLNTNAICSIDDLLIEKCETDNNVYSLLKQERYEKSILNMYATRNAVRETEKYIGVSDSHITRFVEILGYPLGYSILTF